MGREDPAHLGRRARGPASLHLLADPVVFLMDFEPQSLDFLYLLAARSCRHRQVVEDPALPRYPRRQTGTFR